MMKTTIPIFFTFDKYYVLAACVAFDSMLRCANPEYQYDLYVVHTSLKTFHQKRLFKVVEKFANARLHFIDASAYDTAWDKLKNKAHFSKEIFYKLTAATMFPRYNRILFSDVDVIFTGDISPAYFLFPDGDFYFAGTRPIQVNSNLRLYEKDFTKEEIQTISDYEISAGFMLINLKKLREDKKEEVVTNYFRENIHRLILPEQDCIALCLAPQIGFLDYKYVVCESQFFLDPSTVAYNPNNVLLQDKATAERLYREMLSQVVQLHYPGSNKPWNSRKGGKRVQWLEACRKARQYNYYKIEQPLFLWQRLCRYSLIRFIRKQLKS